MTRKQIPQDILEYFYYDDLELRWADTSWNKSRVKGKVAGHIKASDGYRRVFINKQSILVHRIIWFMVTGEQPPSEIDHRDGNRANNAISNLRAASRSQNCRNRNNQSAGVSYSKTKRRWASYIKIDGKQRHLGYFDTREGALQRRMQEEQLLYTDGFTHRRST